MYFIYERISNILVFKTHKRELLKCFNPRDYEVVIY
jgi:hypothetical protein